MDTRAARSYTHTKLATAIHLMAIEAGALSAKEPSTSTLLCNEFSSEQCRNLFPKSLAAGDQEAAQTAAQLAITIADVATPQTRLHELHAQLATQLQRISVDGVGRRIDIVVTTPKGEFWIDVASVHTTAASYLPSTRAWFQREAEAEVCATDTSTENVLTTQNSPAVAATVKKNSLLIR